MEISPNDKVAMDALARRASATSGIAEMNMEATNTSERNAKKAKKRVYQWREKNPEKYRKYQRDLMRARRAK